MQKKYSLSVEDIEELPSWCNDYPKEKYSVYKCCFLSTKKNSHNIPITADLLEKYAPTIKGSWLVAKIENGDATTHKIDEQIFGVFPREQEIEFVEDGDILKAYAYAVVSKRYSKEFNGIFEYDKLRNSSVEMTVMYDEDEKEVLAFDIEALTCLGKTVRGSCPDADIKLVKFSRNTAEKYFSKSFGVSALQTFVNERTLTKMSKYKIDKSAEAMSTDDWGDVDKTKLRNTILEADNKAELVKAVYLYVGDNWENAPSEELKYPVMQLKGDTFVYNRNALTSAKAYAEQNNERSVLEKLDKIYKALKLNDERKEEESKMQEIEFSAVNLGELWSGLYEALNAKFSNAYRTCGIFEENNAKFAILKAREDDTKYRIDFAYTDNGVLLADEVVKTDTETTESDTIRKFAEVEDVDLMKKYKEFEEVEEEETLETLKEKLAKCCKDIEERDNIIMEKDKELAELKEFKRGVEEKEKAIDVEKILAEVSDYADEAQLGEWRNEGLACGKEELAVFANKVKAFCFENSKEFQKKQKTEKKGEVWGFGAPTTSTNKKSSLWD